MEELARLICSLAVFCLICGAVFAVSRRRSRPPRSGPSHGAECIAGAPAQTIRKVEQPYSVFITDFDLELTAREAVVRIATASFDAERGRLSGGGKAWASNIALARAYLEKGNADELAERVAATSPVGRLDGLALTLLIDQSGSMKGEKIAAAAAAAWLVSDAVSGLGGKVEILGFSTAGWHGGFAAGLWQDAGRPPRPGRLCGLLHIIYKDAAGPFDEKAWEAIVHPDFLRENVDGEAVLWGAGRLRRATEQRRVLLVISDGAPVDYSTLMRNDPAILHDHIQKVVADLHEEGDVIVAAVGIDHDVSAYYGRLSASAPASGLVDAIADVLVRSVKSAAAT